MLKNWIYSQNDGLNKFVLSSRIRLARNLKGEVFPHKLDDEKAFNIADRIEKSLDGYSESFKRVNLNSKSNLDKSIYLEKHLISKDLIKASSKSSFFVNDSETISIMINEEDHLRIQTFSEGLSIEQLTNFAIELDEKIEKELPYAFSKKYGYLTACPTNVGTGMRISVMVHLPALNETGNLNKLFRIINNFGMSIRGVYGEGSQSMGDMYQISNNQTLGINEQEIAKNMQAITDKVIEQERIARKYLGKNKLRFEDKLYRSFGILKNARLLSSTECINLLSDVKLGTDMGIIRELDDAKVKKLFLYTRPANLQKYYGNEMTESERDSKRTELIRQIIGS